MTGAQVRESLLPLLEEKLRRGSDGRDHGAIFRLKKALSDENPCFLSRDKFVEMARQAWLDTPDFKCFETEAGNYFAVANRTVRQR